MTSLLPSPPAATFAWEPLPAFRCLAGSPDCALAESGGQRIGILVLAYNAAKTLDQVLHRIPPAVWNSAEEVAVFDDASQDDTWERAASLRPVLPKLSVWKNARNLGYGGNQKAGYAYFLDRGFDIVVLLHGDGQYAPEILARLYHPIAAGEADAVFGSRMIPGYGGPLQGGMPLYKYLGNRILSSLENRALGMQLSEFHSGYRAYRLDALRHIEFRRMTDDFHFDTEIIIKLHHQRYAIREVPIPTYYGSEICHVNGIKYAAQVMRAVWRYRRTCRSLACHPEFQEYFVAHPLKSAPYSSHSYARRMTGAGREVLDLGCGEGFLGAELARDGNRVTGVDRLTSASQAAALERYVQADLDCELVTRRLCGQRFDRVLLLDVLEHLQHPERLFAQCRDLLRADGAVVVSLPNVANAAVRLPLLFGRFEYRERGILDRTHLRFFTRKSARRFLAENGYQILEEKVTVVPLDLALGLKANGRLHRLLNYTLAALTRVFPGLLGYQFVFLARPLRGS